MALKPILAATLATATLGACAITPEQAVPDDIFLLQNHLTVIFSNGMQCRVENITQNPVGTIPNCPVPAQYSVDFLGKSHFGDMLTEPYADVTITKPSGIDYEFKRPRPRDPRWRMMNDFRDW